MCKVYICLRRGAPFDGWFVGCAMMTEVKEAIRLYEIILAR